MGSQTFRVRPIPPPTPYIANRREGRISREELALAASIIPRLENFEFDYNYQIASFTMLANIGGDIRRFVSQSNRFTPEMIQAINSATRGQVITFMEIVTRPGPDGRALNLGSISFNII
jgi:DNA-binding transcriptional regulator YdaS (Cro superfamily)